MNSKLKKMNSEVSKMFIDVNINFILPVFLINKSAKIFG